MFKRKVTKSKCMYNTGAGLKELEIGTIIETTNENLFGDKAITVLGQLEIATPAPKMERKIEDELRDFIFGKTGEPASRGAKVSTLRKQAKSLGWAE